MKRMPNEKVVYAVNVVNACGLRLCRRLYLYATMGAIRDLLFTVLTKWGRYVKSLGIDQRNKPVWPRRAYYMAVFANKPTVKQLKKHKLSDEEAEHVLRTGGGRLRVEYEWYFLNEVEAE